MMFKDHRIMPYIACTLYYKKLGVRHPNMPKVCLSLECMKIIDFIRHARDAEMAYLIAEK